MIVNSSLHGVPLLLLANKQDLEVSHFVKLCGAGVAQLVELWTEKVGPGSIPWCGEGFFSQSQLSVLTPLRCSCSPHVQSFASMSVRSLKIPDAGSHAIAWTHKNTGRNG